MDYFKHREKIIIHVLLIPFIWMVFIPLVILDIFIEIYHHISFPVYGFELVKRSQYIKIDRYKLQYLNLFQKLNCIYCGYANGLLHYSLTIAGKTEKYWCGIKHKADNNFVSPEHHKDFVEFGDQDAFEKKYKQ